MRLQLTTAVERNTDNLGPSDAERVECEQLALLTKVS